jgi:hypothetical protein
MFCFFFGNVGEHNLQADNGGRRQRGKQRSTLSTLCVDGADAWTERAIKTSCGADRGAERRSHGRFAEFAAAICCHVCKQQAAQHGDTVSPAEFAGKSLDQNSKTSRRPTVLISSCAVKLGGVSKVVQPLTLIGVVLSEKRSFRQKVETSFSNLLKSIEQAGCCRRRGKNLI